MILINAILILVAMLILFVSVHMITLGLMMKDSKVVISGSFGSLIGGLCMIRLIAASI